MSTKIEWCDDVFNPITGCTRVGEGCRNCYALKQFDRKLWGYGPEVTFHPERLGQPLRRKKPTHYFVCSMGDLFHESVKEEHIDAVFAVIATARRHTFTILTKRPERMREYLSFTVGKGNVLSRVIQKAQVMDKPGGPYLHDFGWPYQNLRLYVSVWDQPSADEFIPILKDTPAAVRGLSIEPMLSNVRVHHHIYVHPKRCTCINCPAAQERKIHHIICGGETGPGARPMHPDWARSVRDQCQAAGVPFFFKSMGDHYLKELKKTHGSISSERWKESKGMLDGRTWEELPSA